METSLNWLQKLMDNLPEEYLNPPLSEIEEGEEVIGVLTDPWLKRLLGTAPYLTAKTQKLHKDHLIQHLKGEVTGHDCEKVREEVEWLLDQMQVIKNLFWVSVQHSFNIPYGNLGIRANWKIVSMKEEEDNPSEKIPDLLESMASLAIISKMMSKDSPPPDFHSVPPEDLN